MYMYIQEKEKGKWDRILGTINFVDGPENAEYEKEELTDHFQFQ